MQVKATSRLSSASKAGKRGRQGDGGAFQVDFGSAPEDVAKTSRPQATGGIDMLLSLQEVEPIADQRQQAIDDSNQMLDLLDSIKTDLLAGQLTSDRLVKLEGALNRYQISNADPELTEILKAVDLRARVELAKFRQNNS